MSILRTIPGTETNVTPESDVPIIPIDTMYQGDFRLPRKNASLLELFRPVIQAISRRIPNNKEDDIAIHGLLLIWGKDADKK